MGISLSRFILDFLFQRYSNSDIFDMDIHDDQLLDKLGELQRELSNSQMQNALFPNYLAGLSHDIRTPLNAIVGFSGLLTEPDLDSEQIKFYSYMITRSSRRLLSMISNLIDLAKMETGNLKLFNVKVNVSELLDEIRDEMEEERRLYGKDQIEMTFQTPHNGSGNIRIDKTRLYQVLKIFLDNSLKFTKSGKIQVISRIEDGQRISFSIRDTGRGMDKSTLESLFELFPQGPNTEGLKIKSRGLGMLVAQKLTTLMKGEILINSELKTGTTVSLTLPV